MRQNSARAAATTLDTDNARIYRPPDAGALLGLTASTLAKMRCRGDGPPYVKLSPRAVGYRREDILKWIAERVVGSTSEPAR